MNWTTSETGTHDLNYGLDKRDYDTSIYIFTGGRKSRPFYYLVIRTKIGGIDLHRELAKFLTLDEAKEAGEAFARQVQRIRLALAVLDAVESATQTIGRK